MINFESCFHVSIFYVCEMGFIDGLGGGYLEHFSGLATKLREIYP